MNKIVLLDDQSWESYSKWLKTVNERGLYYSTDWLKMLRDIYGFLPYIAVAKNNNEIISAIPFVIIKGRLTSSRMISLPLSHRTPILGEKNGIIEIMNYLSNLAQKLKLSYICVKDKFYREHLPRGWKQSSPFLISQLPLDKDKDKLFQNFSSSNRRAIRKALKSERIEILCSSSFESVLNFRQMMICTRRRQNVPVYPMSFFERLHGLINKGLMSLEIGKVDGRDACGLIRYPIGKDMVYGYGASVNDKNVLRLRPNNLLFWHAILKAKEEGYEYFDFGTALKRGNEGLIRFKENFSATTTPLYYSYYFCNKMKNHSNLQQSISVKVAGRILTKLPFFAYQRFSELIFREFAI